MTTQQLWPPSTLVRRVPPARMKSMRILRVFFIAVLIFAIAGCADIATSKPAGQPPLVISQPAEVLYVGTSRPGLMKYEVMADGSLHSSTMDSSIPAVCWPELSPVPDQIYSLSRPCPFSATRTELRRFLVGLGGNLLLSTSTITLGPNLPSDTGFALKFIMRTNGKLGYAWSVAPDGSQHISPVQISTENNLTVRPDLGISWPPLDEIATRCSAAHIPDAVVETPTGPFLAVRHETSCASNGLTVNYGIYKLDDQSGAIGIALGDAPTDSVLEGAFAAYTGALLVTGETHQDPNFETGKLNLFRVDPSGTTFLNNPTAMTFLQACLPDQPACAHPDAGAFHPSGKWLFIADRQAGGFWTIPVSGDALLPEQASFLPASLFGSMRLAFSSTGKYLYMAQWDGTFAEILGLKIDDATGALTPLMSTPIGKVEAVTAMIDVR